MAGVDGHTSAAWVGEPPVRKIWGLVALDPSHPILILRRNAALGTPTVPVMRGHRLKPLFRFWPKASGHRSLGHRPREAKKQTVYWPKAMFTPPALPVNMAFGQTRPIPHDSWGDAPGYGD